jgi:hypothetical protein
MPVALWPRWEPEKQSRCRIWVVWSRCWGPPADSRSAAEPTPSRSTRAAWKRTMSAPEKAYQCGSVGRHPDERADAVAARSASLSGALGRRGFRLTVL